ncbi:MAG: ATP-dependent 6-phosphofructokinase [Phycisphaerales bacterium]|nr:MAG: ATP-dependent 6-phosphofructokinase [Phycisphaerales bacterium]
MSKSIQRIGVLTGGGDCPGLNAVIRAVAKTAIHQHEIEVIGIQDGFEGLIENRTRPLDFADVSGILARGGTILGTNNKANPEKYYTGDDEQGEPIFINAVDKCLATVEAHKLDALIVIGGDGTMSCAKPLVEAGVNCIGVPKTIDNDIVGTDITFGFTTAANTATLSLDRLHSTAASHHRVMVCEVMGRNAGWLALHAGTASGADVILIPEIPFDIDKVCAFCESRMTERRGFSIIACAEGAKPQDGEQVVKRRVESSPDPIRLGGIGQLVADDIQKRTKIETRTTVLGHVLRGGPPITADRVLASQFGYHAMRLLMQGKKSRMVVMQKNDLSDVELTYAANKQRLVPTDHVLVEVGRAVKTCFGD